MKIPRISVQTIMALVVVVAADGMACHAISSRPGGMTGRLNLLLMNSLPMANLLAIAVGLWIRGRRTLGSFWPGFTSFGLAGLIGSSFGLEPILGWLEATLTASGLVAWAGSSPTREMVAELVILPALLLLPQLVVASIGGGLTRWIGRRSMATTDAASHRIRFASLFAMVAIVLIPGAGIEVYLALAVDRKIERLAVNTEAVIVVKPLPNMQLARPGSKLAVFAPERIPQVVPGTRVKVERDDQTSVIQGMQLGRNGETFVGDFRMVHVTVLDGDSAGKSRMLPRYALQASRSSRFVR